MNKIIFFILFTVILLEAKTKNITLLLPWKHQFQFAGYYVAKELELYKKAGLNVTIIEHDLKRDISKDISSQKYNFGIRHSSVILDKINNYPNLKLLKVIHQSSPFVLLSKKRQDIKTISDFKNKTIILGEDKTDIAPINAMFLSKKLNNNDYKTMKNTFCLSKLIDNSADLKAVYSSNEPYILKEKGIEYTIFDPKDYGFDFYSDILFTSSQMIKTNPDDVKAFTKATMQGWKYAYENIDKTISIILKKYNTQSKTKEALLFEAQTLKKLAFKNGVKFGEINPLRLKEISTTYRLIGLITQKPTLDFNSFIYNVQTNNINSINKEKLLFSSIYKNYKNQIIVFIILIFLLILLILIAAYSRFRVKSLLEIKTKELNKSLEIFDENISSSKTDLDGNITYVSKAFCKISGYSKDELLGKNHRIIKDNNNIEIYKDLWITISSGHIWRGEFKNIKKDGSKYWIKAIISPIFDKDDNITGYESLHQDTTLKKVLKELAITDKSTNLYNKIKIDEDLYKAKKAGRNRVEK